MEAASQGCGGCWLQLGTTISNVAVTHAYALCLIDTGTLARQQAMATADGFLSDQGISPAQRMAIRRSRAFYGLLQTYI